MPTDSICAARRCWRGAPASLGMPAMFGRLSTTIRAIGARSRTIPQERRKFLPERVDLTVDVCRLSRLIRAASAAAKSRHYRVDVVRAGEYRDERGVGDHEWRLLLEEVARHRAAILRSEILQPPAEDCAGNPRLLRLTVKPRARSSRVATCTYPRPFGQSANGKHETDAPTADRIARADCGVVDRGVRLRNRPRTGRTLIAAVLARD